MASSKTKTDNKTDEPKKLFDVVKPGKTAASPTSKPIIVTNRPVLKDPMMVVDSIPNASDEKQEAPGKLSKRVRIEPLSDEESLKSDEPSEPAEEKKTAQPEPDTAEHDTEKLESDQPSELTPQAEAGAPAELEAPKPETEQPDATDEEAGTAQVEQATSADEDKAAKELAKHQAAIEKLVENRTYYLPVNAVAKRRTKRHVALGVLLIIILAAAWVDIALDAGIIHLDGVKAVTHFFSPQG